MKTPIILTTEEGVSLKSGSTLHRCLFICIVKMNSVSSQNSKMASVPLLIQSPLSSYRASQLLRREWNHGLDSRLQRDPLCFLSKVRCVCKNTDWFCLVWFSGLRFPHLFCLLRSEESQMGEDTWRAPLTSPHQKKILSLWSRRQEMPPLKSHSFGF